VISKALRAAFHRLVHRFRPRRWGPSVDHQVQVLERGLLGAEVPASLHRPAEPGVQALIVLVVQITARISRSIYCPILQSLITQ
jgi:hypothetical protein